MKEVFQKLTNYLIRVYLKNEENQIVFPPYVILLFRVQQAFLSLSYIYGLSNYYYIYMISIYARPQQYFIDSEIPQYIILMLSVIYIFTLLTIIPYNNIIGIFGQLLRSSMLNFFFEISKGSISIITHTLLVLISFSETLIISGTLNVQTKNFQHTRFTNLDLIVVILNYLLMIFYSYGFPQSIIVILAIILNILRIINQLLFSSFKNLITKTILLTIKIITFFFGWFWIAQLQIHLSAEIVIIPLIYKMIYTYYQNQLKNIVYNNQKHIPCHIISLLAFLENVKDIQLLYVSKPKKPRNRIIYSSFLIYQNKNYQAFLELNSIQDDQLSLIESLKKKIILQKCINNIQKIICGTNKIDNIAHTIKLLLNSEEQNYSIQNDIVEIVQNKIHCLEQFTQHQSHNSYENYHNIIKKIINFKEKLEKQYKEFPCEKTQGILGFFYGEIMNDYLQANQLFNLVAMQDEKIKKITLNQDIFSNKMIYLILKFDGKLIIKRPSSDAAQFLQLTNQQLKGLELQYLIPKGVQEIHDDLVLNFLKYGKSKYMRQLNQCLLYNHEMEFMSSVELLFDINFVEELNFIAFLQPPANQTLNLILNEQHLIKCISQQFIQELGIEQQYKQYQGNHINKLIPNFPKYFFDKQQIENTEIYVEKQIDEQSQTSSHPLVFITTFNLHFGIVHDITKYFIISFDYFKRSPFYFCQNQSISVPFMSPLIKKQNHCSLAIINDESTIHVPYQEDEVMKNHYIFQLNQQDFNFLDNTPTIQDQKKQQTKLLSTLDYTNIKSTTKQNELLLAEQKFFSKPKIKSSISNGDQVIFMQEVQSSQVSSLQGVRNSKYFRQFEMIAKIKDLNSFSKLHRIFLASIILCVVFQFIIQTIQIIELNFNLKDLVSDIDILQIKNFVFQPLETFLLTRWTIFNYKLLNDAGEISNLEYQNLIQFPLSNLNLGYDSLDKNLKQVFNRPALQNFLEKTYIEIYEYVTTNQGELYNLNLRNSISILKNFQYSFKMAYELDGGIVSDSPYVYFQYKNYLTIKQQFSELNSIVLDQTLKRSLQIQSKLSIITFICLGALTIQYSFSVIYFILLQKIVLKHYSLTQYLQIQYIEFEITYLKKLIEGVNQNQNLLFRYQFRLDNKESLLDSTNLKIYQKKRNIKQLSILNYHDIYYYLFFFILLLLTAGNASLTYYEGWNYLEKYPETAKFYKEVSDVGTDVPTMFAQRDVLYSRKAIIPYFTQNEYDSLLEEIVESLNRTKAFIQDDYNFDKYVVSDSFKGFFTQIQNDSLCDFIPLELKNKSNNICQIVLNQNMKRGLQALLIYIINHITTDMEINQFTSRSQVSYLELEGAFLVSNIIKVVNDKFNIDLMDQTKYFMNLINMHNIIMFINLFLIEILIITYIKNKLIEKLHIAQRLTYIMPSKSIILDSNFERALRSLLKDQ
ncbi:unnamed protein product [Paramecium primaurelia]|uniref:Transmembrane protein n=1 Tax=Paramecium primaurelia TaxID=5886 RepID=A0A8S1N1S5_PARPR|nr:unnamed protein product [Paramecium primaurelia]